EAGVSNPLIYKYFDTRLQVLQELLIREAKSFRASVSESLTPAKTYPEAVRLYVDINFQQFAGGDVLSILFNQPDVRQALTEGEGHQRAPFFIKQLAKEYNISNRRAEKLVVMASAASLAAAEHYGRFGGDRDAQIDQAVDFIFGGINSVLNTAEN
ncbi:MAG: TetR/AcrR family transcriptional regulator, partial [Pseudomonadota bacterium]